MAQTAIEWLALRYHHRQGYLSQEDIEQALEIEKKQLIDAACYDPYLSNLPEKEGEHYYKKTYGK